MKRGRAEMSQRVMLDEGGSVSVHTRIKDMCKAARNRQGLTNQEISNIISERFGIEDFSVNTVNNFFSERSKATTIYTTGYICAALGISIDTVFGIETRITTEEETEFVRQLQELKVELRLKEQQTENLEKLVAEKEARLEQAHSALEHYRKQVEASSRKVQPWVFIATLALLVVSVIFIVVYLMIYDVRNPNYGLFQRASLSAYGIRYSFACLCRFLR